MGPGVNLYLYCLPELYTDPTPIPAVRSDQLCQLLLLLPPPVPPGGDHQSRLLEHLAAGPDVGQTEAAPVTNHSLLSPVVIAISLRRKNSGFMKDSIRSKIDINPPTSFNIP